MGIETLMAAVIVERILEFLRELFRKDEDEDKDEGAGGARH